jgi:phosphoglycolate phosphatase
VQGLKEGRISRSEMLVPGSLTLLEALRQRGVTCYLASGTDMAYVQDEARALGLEPYFAGGIYGALDNWESFSKAMLIAQIIAQHQLRGHEFVAFGDGFVEIENAVAVGGIAVGVATDEVRRAGVNAWKRERLIGAGAHLIIPDFRQADALLHYLLDEA